MEKREKRQLIVVSVVFILYVLIILSANIFMRLSESDGNETFEMISGILFGFIGIPIFSIIIPIWLSKKWRLDFSFWPKTKNLLLVISVLAVFTILVNFESIKTIIQLKISIKDFGIHYVSTLLFHVTYYPLFVLFIFPVLRKNFGLKLSLIITALAFALYHLAQFHFYPAGTTLFVQIYLFSYFIASLLFYLWSESLILAALVHQTTGALAVAANGSIHSEIDFLFYLTIPIIVILFGYMVIQAIKNKNRMELNSNWWLKIYYE